MPSVIMQSPLDLVDAISTRVGAQSLAAAPSATPAGGVDKKSCDPATATGVAAFATALFGKVCEARPDEAVTVVSPLSVAAALALALAGATGASAAELTTLLGVPNRRNGMTRNPPQRQFRHAQGRVVDLAAQVD